VVQYPLVEASPLRHLPSKSSTPGVQLSWRIVAVDNCMQAICWTRYFLESQGIGVYENILYQDNQGAILLEKNGKA